MANSTDTQQPAGMSEQQFAAILQREAAATPGPWGWRGHLNASVELRALHSGGLRIISTSTDRPCIDFHDDVFFLRVPGDFANGDGPCATCREAYKAADFLDNPPECERSDAWDTIHVWGPGGAIVPINGYAKAEVLQWSDHVYRDDVKDTTHPDAEFIAAAREDVPALLAEVERLRAEVERLRRLDEADACTCPEPAPLCGGCNCTCHADAEAGAR